MSRPLFHPSVYLGLVLATGPVHADTPPAAAPASAEDAKPDFESLVVDFKPFGAVYNHQTEHLKFESNGVCWYRIDGYEALRDIPARNGAAFNHKLSPARIQRLNRLLKETKWFEADGASGRALQLHAGTISMTLKRGGKEKSVSCEGDRPAPYAALLHELLSIAAQERRIYLHDYVSGRVGTDAWQEIGLELAALRGEPYSKSTFEIDYTRYLPIARRILRDFHGQQEEELVPAIRLIAHLKSRSELPILHRLADDRSHKIRQEVARALGMLHDKDSLPILVAMLPASGTGKEVAWELIQWGNDAIVDIVKLIGQSTDASLEVRDRIAGEDLIRAYIEHPAQVKPVDPAVIAAVRQALAAKDPRNGLIRTSYHNEFLKNFANEAK